MRVLKRRPECFVLLLCLATSAVFAPWSPVSFLNFDDTVYLTRNSNVRSGLTASGLGWAFSSLEVYWQPVTWVSHMVDFDLFGSNALGHRISNVCLQVLTTALLMRWLRTFYTGAELIVVAAGLWSLHPLRVESVAWISERKDVLSGLFGVLTLLLWQRYKDAPSTGRYVLVLLVFAMALGSKPICVVLPLALLLLDLWPRRTFSNWASLVLEKLPLFAMSLAVGMLTIIGQRDTGALALVEVPLSARLANATVSTMAYLGKMMWPVNLAAFYPYPPNLKPVTLGLCGVVLSGITVMAVFQRSRRPHLLFGWLWYLIFLLPSIGIIQAGRQSMGDRFTYWPMIGVAVAVVGESELWLQNRPALRPRAKWFSVGVMSVLALLSWNQAGYWRDSVTLFEHSLSAGGDNEYIRDYWERRSWRKAVSRRLSRSWKRLCEWLLSGRITEPIWRGWNCGWAR